MSKEEGFVSAESVTAVSDKGSLTITVQFPEYSAASVSVASDMIRVGTIRVLPNIGYTADSSVDVLDGFTTTMENLYHLKNVKRFL